MNTINVLVAILLGLGTALFATFFFLGSSEQHHLLLQEGWFYVFGWRFYGFAMIGLMGSCIWWIVNWILLKTRLATNIKLGRTAILLVAAPLTGALLGAFLFCVGGAAE